MLNMYRRSSFHKKKCRQYFLAEMLVEKKPIEKPAIKHKAHFLQHTQKSTPTWNEYGGMVCWRKRIQFLSKKCVMCANFPVTLSKYLTLMKVNLHF